MATLLLVSFAVAVGVVIMNFTSAQVEEEAECAVEINLKLATIAGSSDFCYSEAKKELKFTVENGINTDISGLIVNVIGSEKAETFELNEAKMSKAGIYVGHIKYDRDVAGNVRQVKITPKIIPFDEEQICSEKAVVVESVTDC